MPSTTYARPYLSPISISSRQAVLSCGRVLSVDRSDSVGGPTRSKQHPQVTVRSSTSFATWLAKESANSSARSTRSLWLLPSEDIQHSSSFRQTRAVSVASSGTTTSVKCHPLMCRYVMHGGNAIKSLHVCTESEATDSTYITRVSPDTFCGSGSSCGSGRCCNAVSDVNSDNAMGGKIVASMLRTSRLVNAAKSLSSALEYSYDVSHPQVVTLILVDSLSSVSVGGSARRTEGVEWNLNPRCYMQNPWS